MTSAHQDALSLAAILNPGILARALDCEKHVAAHPHNPDATESIRKAGVSYRRQLADVVALIEPVLKRRDEEARADGRMSDDPWDDFPPGGFHSSSPVMTLDDHIARFAGELKCSLTLARQLIMSVGINSLAAMEGVEERDLTEAGFSPEDAALVMRLFAEVKP